MKRPGSIGGDLPVGWEKDVVDPVSAALLGHPSVLIPWGGPPGKGLGEDKRVVRGKLPQVGARKGLGMRGMSPNRISDHRAQAGIGVNEDHSGNVLPRPALKQG